MAPRSDDRIMSDQSRLELINKHPIGDGLGTFRFMFTSYCTQRNLVSTVDALRQLDYEELRALSSVLAISLATLPVSNMLHLTSGRTTLRTHLQRLGSAISSPHAGHCVIDDLKPLLEMAMSDQTRDEQIWDFLSTTAVETTPPPQPAATSLQQTPFRSTSSVLNSPELRRHMDQLLTQELGSFSVDVPNFCDVFFGGIQELDNLSRTVFNRCLEGDDPLFNGKWTKWPVNPTQENVLPWFTDLVPKLEAFAACSGSAPTRRRKLLAQPRTPLLGSTGKRSMDIGFVNSDLEYEQAANHPRHRWSHVLIACELKCNPKADIASVAWIDLARQHYIEIERKGQKERLIIDKVMKRSSCVSGRATTCWKAHHEDDPSTPLVIKDSWQYIERDEEGELIQEATEKGVSYVARYYHHETVRIGASDDDVKDNVRRGLDVTKAPSRQSGRKKLLLRAVLLTSTSSTSKKGQGSGSKRPSSIDDTILPPAKRSCSTSSMTAAPNRIHRRVIVRDYGKPIYEASTRAALLAAFECCVRGHELLYKAGFLHRDISTNNLMINEDAENSSWPGFLIDFDHAIKIRRDSVSGAKGKTGTRAFMAIGLLNGEIHSFMHDLESFFWVLFWICIHYEGHGKSVGTVKYDHWNYDSLELLADIKAGTIANEATFLSRSETYFTPHYKPLIPWGLTEEANHG
ncbi:uncharacterized protein UV8b_05970 [Ustilaginoidea virens]|uniref:non-specific serine/threonine protein kinase n=1 Tax=Ustilaginoidea virens TaxID=1159556 RepID=A0A8E5MJL2_USTVR|nr:uncharacterized protein UV8b_05970 [Ustilaginoidea virens]QUC21727.1 hypothetical protein UV8b_05970 [Ustilaginoidea virens]